MSGLFYLASVIIVVSIAFWIGKQEKLSESEQGRTGVFAFKDADPKKKKNFAQTQSQFTTQRED
jgi:hypothetical protein